MRLLVQCFLSMALTLPLLATTADAATFRIRDDGNGGDCAGQNFPGAWDGATKTCSLTDDLTGAIILVDDGLTLAGGGHTLTPAAGDTYAVYSGQTTGVAIRNVKLSGYAHGIVLVNVQDATVSGNEIDRVFDPAFPCGICLVSTNGTTVAGNDLRENLGPGIRLFASNSNVIHSNTLTKNRSANIFLDRSSGNQIRSNEILGDGRFPNIGVEIVSGGGNFVYRNRIDGAQDALVSLNLSNANHVAFNSLLQSDIGLMLKGAQRNRLYCNDISSDRGVDMMARTAGNAVWWNNFGPNTKARDRNPGGLNRFDLGRDIGGNHWRDHAPNCVDGPPADGICDAAYNFPVNVDLFPHVAPIAWRLNPYICMATAATANEETPEPDPVPEPPQIEAK